MLHTAQSEIGLLRTIPVPEGGMVNFYIVFSNVGGESGYIQLLTALGKYNSEDSKFTFDIYHITDNLPAGNPGGVWPNDLSNPAANEGTWDGLVGIGRWDGETFLYTDLDMQLEAVRIY